MVFRFVVCGFWFMFAFRFRVCLVLDYCCFFWFWVGLRGLGWVFGGGFVLLVSWLHAPFDYLV